MNLQLTSGNYSITKKKSILSNTVSYLAKISNFLGFEEKEELKEVINDSDDDSSCESIPEEFHHSPTIPHSPTDDSRPTKTEEHLETSTSANYQDSKLGTKDDILQSIENPKTLSGKDEDPLKKLMKNFNTYKKKEHTPSFHEDFEDDVDRLNCSTQTDLAPKNKLHYKKNKKPTSPFKFYKGIGKGISPCKSTKGSVTTRNAESHKNMSFVLPGNTSIGVKKENQIYARSLEEFVDSNIKWINDLIEYKQETNHNILKLNTLWKDEKVETDYQKKRQVQLKSELQNIQANNKIIQGQNQEMRERLQKIREKLFSKERIYVSKLLIVENQLNAKKDEVNAIFTEITQTKDEIWIREKENKQQVKQLEWEILEAEKLLCKFNENLNISKHYEAHRLQILRDKQKKLGEAIWRDSYQYF